jgi:hypothetical protein
LNWAQRTKISIPLKEAKGKYKDVGIGDARLNEITNADILQSGTDIHGDHLEDGYEGRMGVNAIFVGRSMKRHYKFLEPYSAPNQRRVL